MGSCWPGNPCYASQVCCQHLPSPFIGCEVQLVLTTRDGHHLVSTKPTPIKPNYNSTPLRWVKYLRCTDQQQLQPTPHCSEGVLAAIDGGIHAEALLQNCHRHAELPIFCLPLRLRDCCIRVTSGMASQASPPGQESSHIAHVGSGHCTWGDHCCARLRAVAHSFCLVSLWCASRRKPHTLALASCGPRKDLCIAIINQAMQWLQHGRESARAGLRVMRLCRCTHNKGFASAVCGVWRRTGGSTCSGAALGPRKRTSASC